MTKRHEPKHAQSTRLACHAPGAKAVFLAGTFDDGSQQFTPMATDADGNWTVAVGLKPGDHEFEFIVDVQWCCKPDCDGRIVTPLSVGRSFGTMNCG
jgi:1,4-alpha-glucan branching enzyme